MPVDPYVIESGSGTPVVLLHAFPLTAAMWSPQRAALSAAGYHVITPDQRGFGGSQLGDEEPSLDLVADDVARVLDARKVDQAVVGGLSMGGYVAMAFARRHPERLAALVLADTKAGADAEAAVAGRLDMAARLDEAATAELLVEELLPKLVGTTTQTMRPLVHGRVKALVEKAPPAAAAWAQRAMAARPDSSETLRGLDVPLLVVVGEEDVMSPVAEAEAMVDAAPRATLVRISAAGHLSAVETPDEFNTALLAFLATL